MKLLEIGKMIKERRANLHITQEDLAEMSAVGIRTIHQIESGTGNPSYQTLDKLLDVLGLDFSIYVKGTR